MVKYLFDKKIELKSLRVTGTYPSKDNCYEIEVKYRDGVMFVNHFVPKVEYDLAIKMKELLTQKQINQLLPLIDKLGSEQYYEGGLSESMSNDESM